MLRKKRKGQSMVEFAFALPVLLLLILGIIETGRVIWAYITVQASAREATRYAVTGKPYIDEDTPEGDPVCTNPDGENDATDPWLCHPQTRVKAIEEIALHHGRPLGLQRECRASELISDPADELEDICDQPGAFGVEVNGQIISPTISLTQPVSIRNHAGVPGLVIEVNTFYNVQMIDPLYDVLLGGNFITLRGSMQMQNEGIESTLGSIPPPAVADPILPSGSGPSLIGYDPSNPYDPNNPNFDPTNPPPVIKSLNGYSVYPGDRVQIRLENHDDSLQYDIYLGDYKICANQTIVNSSEDIEIEPGTIITITYAEFDCFADVPPGLYPLYSTVSNTPNQPQARAPEDMEVKENMARIRLKDRYSDFIGDTWAANSPIDIQLLNHIAADGSFNIYFDYGGPNQQLITTVSDGSADIPWQVPTLSGCKPCVIESRRVSDESTVYAETDLYIYEDPQIVLGGNTMVFAQGEKIFVYLRDHTPGLRYDIKFSGENGSVAMGRTETTNNAGDTTAALEWTVYQQHPDWPDGIPDGFYDISSHSAVGSTASLSNMDSSNQIAILNNIEIDTPDGPYITVDGGYSWPAGSNINIRVHKHPEDTYYLEFGDWRVQTTQPNDTFTTGVNETAVVGYQIPITATAATPSNYLIESFLASTNDLVASRTVEVLPEAAITVLEGERVLPNATINIELTGHAPNASYAVYYADTKLFEILTDQNGYATRAYDLEQFTGSVTYGLAYDLYSSPVGASVDSRAATTQLTLIAADLQITQVDYPANAQINTAVPITLTIENISTAPISRYFDIDFYLNPSPLLPGPEMGHAFPGDIKTWQDSVPPGGSFTVQEDLFLRQYGQQEVFGFADTSDFIIEDIATNNVLSNSFVITCSLSSVVDTFDSLDYSLMAQAAPATLGQFALASSHQNWTAVSAGYSLAPQAVQCGGCKAAVTPDSLTFTATEGGSNPADQTLTISTGNQSASWTASSDSSWLSVSPTSDSLGKNSSVPATVSVDISGLAAGSYSGQLTFDEGGKQNVINVSLTVEAGATTPVLSVDTSTMSFTATEGGSNPADQSFTISNSGDGDLNWSIGSLPSWLSVSPASGVSGAIVQVSADISGLSAGTYTGQIPISSDGGSHTIDVTLTVQSGGTTTNPVLSVDTSSMSFTATQGGSNPANQTFNISNTGDGDLNWSTSGLPSWLSVSPTSGTNDAAVTVSADVSGLSAGTYTGDINISSDGGSHTISVTFLVEATPGTLSCGGCKYYISPDQLNFSAYEEDNSSVQPANPYIITIYNTQSNKTLAWTAGEAISWLSMNTYGTTLGEGGSVDVDVTIDVTGLTPGTYSGTIDFTAEGKSVSLPVSLTVSEAPPVLSVSPATSFSFTATEGGSNPASQTFDIANTGGGTLNWSISDDAAWLSVTPASGTDDGTATMAVDITGLSAGTYSGQITVSSDGGSQTVDVSLTVNSSAPAVLAVDPTTLSFVATEGGDNPAGQSFTIANTGGSTLNWTVSDDAAWLSTDRASGTGDATVNVSVGIAGLSAGTYTAQITVNSDGGDQTIDVTLTVNSGGSQSLADWSGWQYGDSEADTDPYVNNGHLFLSSDGSTYYDSSDHNLVFNRTTPITTDAGFDVSVQMFAAPCNTQFAGAGLDLRTSTEDDSPKINFGLGCVSAGSSEYHLLATTRSETGGSSRTIADDGLVTLAADAPVWLRIEREAGTNTFNFYYLQQTATPAEADWGEPYASQEINLDSLMYAGLYNVSYANGTYAGSEFDNFTVTDPSSCQGTQAAATNVPPGLQVCDTPLTQRGFESLPLSDWQLAYSEGVAVSPDNAHTGRYKLLAPTFDGAFYNPYFYQSFNMPDWILSNTTSVQLHLYRNIDNLAYMGSSDDPDDKFYAVLSASSDPSAPALTEPALVATGQMDSATYDPSQWQSVTVKLEPSSGVNLEDYVGQKVYLLLYNNSNQQDGCPPPGTHCHATKFYFDDFNLSACTSEPLPHPIASRVTGNITLYHNDGSKEQIAGVKVWAYSEGGEMHETFTIQDGSYSFYNLPATAEGVTYYLYAEYHLVDPDNPGYIESLVPFNSPIEILLKSSNDNTNPLEIDLDLYSLTS